MKRVTAIFICLIASICLQAQSDLMKKLENRPYPQWFDEAKLGIFVHYGLYSIPSYSDKEQYAEWFYKGLISQDSLRIKFQKEVFGENFKYEDYKDLFKAELFDANQWAELFKKAGARYVVFTSKHHDGYCMYDSRYANGWSSATTGPRIDFCEELSKAVRENDMRMCLYYSLTEWTNPLYRWTVDTNKSIDSYIEKHLHPQFKELVDKFKPSLIFSDGDWDFDYKTFKSDELVSYYYDVVGEEAIVNDRWGHGFNYGYLTPEYSESIMVTNRPWAECRGLSRSFGLNRNADLSSYLTSEDLIKHFVRSVAGGGGLTLNVGPAADGSIPLLQQERLLKLGEWLQINGEAIYASKPFYKNMETYEVVLPCSNKEINFDWVRNAPENQMPTDHFAINWQTNFTPEKTDKYKFYLNADENAGFQILDEENKVVFQLAAEKEEVQAEVKLKKGRKYTFELVYQEKTHEAVVSLLWENSSMSKQPVRTLENWKGEMSWKQSYVCFTVNNGNLYAVALEPLSKQFEFTLENAPDEDMKVCLLAEKPIYLDWSYDNNTKKFTIDTSKLSPADVKTIGAWVFRLEGYMQTSN
ncbi:MAG: alpha-L-fucosidase [Bacteroidales bacterium]|nr:alpha-L-fucosidase [Bacteroidales bacterium]